MTKKLIQVFLETKGTIYPPELVAALHEFLELPNIQLNLNKSKADVIISCTEYRNDVILTLTISKEILK